MQWLILLVSYVFSPGCSLSLSLSLFDRRLHIYLRTGVLAAFHRASLSACFNLSRFSSSSSDPIAAKPQSKHPAQALGSPFSSRKNPISLDFALGNLWFFLRSVCDGLQYKKAMTYKDLHPQ